MTKVTISKKPTDLPADVSAERGRHGSDEQSSATPRRLARAAWLSPPPWAPGWNCRWTGTAEFHTEGGPAPRPPRRNWQPPVWFWPRWQLCRTPLERLRRLRSFGVNGICTEIRYKTRWIKTKREFKSPGAFSSNKPELARESRCTGTYGARQGILQ